MSRTITHSWRILSVTSAGSLITAINTGTLKVAVPTLMEKLNAPLTDASWILMSYMVTLTLTIIFAGKLSDVFGRKTVYLIGLALFTLSSVLAGFANSSVWIIAARALQGIGGAAMTANSLAMVTDAFPAGERGAVLGINNISIAAGAISGPLVGGAFIEIGWRWVFWFNAPLGLLLFFWAWFVLPVYRPKSNNLSFDTWGTISLFLGLLGILGGITYGETSGWDNWYILFMLFVGILGFTAFIWAERKAADPIVRFELFRNRMYAIANACTFINSLVRSIISFVLILYLQGVHAFSPLQAGMAMIPMAGAMALVGPFSGRLSDKIGSRIPASLGLMATAIGTASLLFIHGIPDFAYMFFCLIFIGAGSGLFQSPNTVAIMNASPKANRSVVAGTRMMLNNLGMLLSMSLSVALISMVMSDANLFQNQVLPQEQASSFVYAMQIIFCTSAIISFLGAILSWMREPVHGRENQSSQ